jgi:hypothetical protein
MAAGAKITPVAAVAGTIPGPHVFNPLGGVGITGTKSTVAQNLDKGQSYPSVLLTTGGAADFSTAGGFLVFNFGFANQVGPVRYLGRLSDDELVLDASFHFPDTIVSGDTITLLQTPSAFVPADPPSVGSFYITASPAGRVAAERLIQEISAAGIELSVQVRYPGDRGMGAEGFPARNNYKLSDKVWVWGGDELDQELEVARG